MDETPPSLRQDDDKTQFSRNFVAIVTFTLIVMVVILVLIALKLSHQYGGKSGSNAHRLKNTDFCDQALRCGLNLNAEPCNDFHKYVCGNDERRPRRPHGFEWRIIESLNLTRAPSEQVSLKQKVDAFFQSCLRRNQPPHGGFRSWFQKFCGGILGGQSVHFMTALTNLSMYWRLHLLFEVSMEFKHTLVLRPLNSRHWREQRTWLTSSGLYDQFIADALDQVLEGNFNKGSMLIRVKNFEDTLYARFFSGPLRISEDPFKWTNVSELSTLTPSVSLDVWLTSLNTVLPFPIDARSPVKLFSGQVIDIINLLTSSIEQTDIEPLLRWLIGKQLYSVQYKPLMNNQHELAIQCLRISASGMGEAVVLPVLDDLSAGQTTILNLASRVLHALAAKLKGVMWLREEELARSLESVLNTTYVLGVDLSDDKETIDQLYSKLPSLDVAFLENWLRVCEALRTYVGRGRRPWGRVLNKDSLYSTTSPLVILPLWRITRPSFDYRNTSRAEATILASHMAIMAILAYGNTSMSYWSQDARTEYEKRRHCLKDTFNVRDTAVGEEIGFAFSAALEASLDVSQELHLQPASFNDYNSKQTFFLWWCFETCGRSALLCNVPLRNSYSFSEAFNCSLGSPMNPATKCSLW